MAAAHAAHAQAAMAAAIQSNAWHLAAMAQQLPPEPPRNLVLQPAGSLSSGQQSLGSNESEGYPPWHTTDQNQPIKTPTIVRNPAHQPPKMRQKVVLRTKKGRSSVDSHFRRSLGFDTPVTLKKRPSSMIEHSEVMIPNHHSKLTPIRRSMIISIEFLAQKNGKNCRPSVKS